MNAVSVFAPGPLPVIKAVAEECGLVEVLDERLAWDPNQCTLSPGQRHLALVMNLLTEGVALYRMPEFFENTDTENLFGDGITPEHLNDDSLGRGLDSLAEAGPQSVIGHVLVEAAAREDVATDVLHADTTSISVQGQFETDDPDEEALDITYGHSKDHRPDLKQYKLGLGVNRSGVPIIGDILDGSASDKTWNTRLIGELKDRLKTDTPPVYVADSEAVTGATLDGADEHGIKLISRLPRTYNLPDELIDRASETDDWVDLGAIVDDEDAATYRLQSFEETLHDHAVRCIVVHSSSLEERADRRLDDQLESATSDLEATIDELSNRYFSCAPDAQEALEEWLDAHDHEWFTLEAEVVETERKKSRDGPGRPPTDWEPYEPAWQLEVRMDRDDKAIEQERTKSSCFVLVTTLLDEDAWPADRVLEEYKEQQAVERRFPVVKDAKHVGPVFLKSPERVEALGYVLIMALLVYSLIERRARQALAEADEPMRLAGGPTSFRPTGRRVLERFQNAMVMHVDGERVIPENADIPERVLDLLGFDVSVYGVEASA